MVRAAWQRALYSSSSSEMNWYACGGPWATAMDALDPADRCFSNRTFISNTYSLACCSRRWYSWYGSFSQSLNNAQAHLIRFALTPAFIVYTECFSTIPVNKLLHALFVPVQRLILIISQWSSSLTVNAPDQVSHLGPVILQLLRLPLGLGRDLPDQWNDTIEDWAKNMTPQISESVQNVSRLCEQKTWWLTDDSPPLITGLTAAHCVCGEGRTEIWCG